jgi:hypothetical protein
MTSISLVFVYTNNNRPVKMSKSWHEIGIRQVRDIVEWHHPEIMLRVKDIRSNIHFCLRKWLTIAQIELSPLFEHLKNSVIDSLDGYESLWMLTNLAVKPLHEYAPKMGRTYQQRCIVTVTLSYNYLVIPISIWWSINRPVLMPKLRTLVLLIHAGDYKTSKCYTKFTNTSSIYPHCQQVTEWVKHALIERQEVYSFWPRFDCTSFHSTVNPIHVPSYHYILSG